MIPIHGETATLEILVFFSTFHLGSIGAHLRLKKHAIYVGTVRGSSDNNVESFVARGRSCYGIPTVTRRKLYPVYGPIGMFAKNFGAWSDGVFSCFYILHFANDGCGKTFV